MKWEKWTDLITLLITRKDNVAQNLLFMRVSATQSDSSPMSSAIRDGSERSLPFLRFWWNFLRNRIDKAQKEGYNNAVIDNTVISA